MMFIFSWFLVVQIDWFSFIILSKKGSSLIVISLFSKKKKKNFLVYLCVHNFSCHWLWQNELSSKLGCLVSWPSIQLTLICRPFSFFYFFMFVSEPLWQYVKVYSYYSQDFPLLSFSIFQILSHRGLSGLNYFLKCVGSSSCHIPTPNKNPTTFTRLWTITITNVSRLLRFFDQLVYEIT